jgi:hygromycin-B 7''-O-kinase
MTVREETPGMDVDVVAARYGVEPAGVRELAGGVASRVFELGNDLVLRVPRAAEFEGDLRKEVAVIPIARRAGVRTPAIVEFDESRALIDAPYVVMERVYGNELEATTDGRPEVWEELGSQLARLHRTHQQPIAGVLADDGGGDPREVVDELAGRGYLDRSTAYWLIGWFERLGDRFDRDAPVVLLHGDVAPQNLLVSEGGEYEALIDWGDAAWGPRGMEFAKLPLERVALVLPSYRETQESDQNGELEAAALWYHLSWGLSALPREPRTDQRHWTAPPASRLLGVLRFFASTPPSPWADLT